MGQGFLLRRCLLLDMISLRCRCLRINVALGFPDDSEHHGRQPSWKVGKSTWPVVIAVLNVSENVWSNTACLGKMLEWMRIVSLFLSVVVWSLFHNSTSLRSNFIMFRPWLWSSDHKLFQIKNNIYPRHKMKSGTYQDLVVATSSGPVVLGLSPSPCELGGSAPGKAFKLYITTCWICLHRRVLPFSLCIEGKQEMTVEHCE